MLCVLKHAEDVKGYFESLSTPLTYIALEPLQCILRLFQHLQHM